MMKLSATIARFNAINTASIPPRQAPVGFGADVFTPTLTTQTVNVADLTEDQQDFLNLLKQQNPNTVQEGEKGQVGVTFTPCQVSMFETFGKKEETK